MKTTDELIASLASGAGPVTPTPAPFALLAKWALGAVVYVALALSVSGPRGDLMLALHSPLYLAEVLALAGLGLSSALAAATLAFPDLHQKRAPAFLPLLMLAVFLAVLCAEALNDNPPAPMPVHGIECLECITLYSLLPAAWILFVLRRQASVHSRMAGTVALLAAASLGCLILRLSEKTDSIRHLAEWHYLPIFGFALLGMIIGRRFLKW